MEINDGKRVDILMAQLMERYTALHKMRDRSMQFTLWILGLGLGLAWLLITQIVLNRTQMFVLGFFLFIIGILALNFLRAINRGFNTNRNIMVRIETLLKLHEEGAYWSAEPVLPKEFSESKFRWSGHFPTLYLLTITIFILLLILTFASPLRCN